MSRGERISLRHALARRGDVRRGRRYPRRSAGAAALVAVGLPRGRRARAAGRARRRPAGQGAHQRLAAVHHPLGVSGRRVALPARLHDRRDRRLRRPGRLDVRAGRPHSCRHVRLAAPRREAAAAPSVVSVEADLRGQSPLGDGAGRGEPDARARAAPGHLRRGAGGGAAAAGACDARGRGAAGRRGSARRGPRVFDDPVAQEVRRKSG